MFNEDGLLISCPEPILEVEDFHAIHDLPYGSADT
jgi:hypothetical protein